MILPILRLTDKKEGGRPDDFPFGRGLFIIPRMSFLAFWGCPATWRRSSYNTMWCLIGCAAGDMGTVFVFQNIDHSLSVAFVFMLAMINGLIASICLETFILFRRGMDFHGALRTALRMSFISMLAMETMMNLVDYWVTGGARLTLLSVPLMLIAGFLTPLPYNYWRLKKYGKACH